MTIAPIEPMLAYEPCPLAAADEDELPSGVGETEPAGEPEPPAAGAVEDADDGEGRAAGVLRLLQAGHFRGVADVRLRINFHEELSALEAGAAKAAAGAAAADLSAGIAAALEQAASSEGVSEDDAAVLMGLKEQFGQAVGEAVEAFQSGEGVDGPALTAAAQDAFDSLSAGVEEAFSAVPPEPGAEAPEPEGPAPAVDAEALLASLQETFAADMQALSDALSGASLLPELSGPSGRGAAYEKFLAMYEELIGLDEPPPEPEPSAAVDVEA